MLSLPIYQLGSMYYLHTRINGKQVKRSLRTGYRRVAIMRAVSLLNELTMNKVPPGVPSTYTLDIDKGIFQADGEEDHKRMLEAASLALQLRNSTPAAQAPAPLPQVDPNILKLGELLEKFFALKKVKPGTVTMYRNSVKEFSTFLKNPPITQITRSDITRFQEHLAGKGNGVHTIENKVGNLRSILNFAVQQGYTREANPAAGRSLMTKRQKLQSGFAIFEREEIAAFFQSEFYQEQRAKDPDYTNAVLFGLFTGCRVGEITTLKRNQFKMSPGGTHYITIRDAKTMAGVREVPLLPDFYAMLEPFIGSKPDKVFKYAERDGKGAGNAVGKKFARNLTSANIHREKLVFHSLRKFVNNELLNHNVSLEHRCQLVGHEIDNVNVSIYSKKVNVDALAAAVFPTFDDIFSLIETSITHQILSIPFIESSI